MVSSSHTRDTEIGLLIVAPVQPAWLVGSCLNGNVGLSVASVSKPTGSFRSQVRSLKAAQTAPASGPSEGARRVGSSRCAAELIEFRP